MKQHEIQLIESEIAKKQKTALEAISGIDILLQNILSDIGKYSKYDDLSLRIIKKRTQLKKILDEK